MTYKITKRFGPYPAAHRQHNHHGHCADIHGHNFYFEADLIATALTENGFVYDFGNFEFLKHWLTKTFDHTLLLNQDDNLALTSQDVLEQLADIVIVDSGSAEGLARMVFNYIETSSAIQEGHSRGLMVVAVRCYEDEKNYAQYS